MGHPMTRNPYVFVVGCNRSGTTLLQRMLDAHPDLAILHEASFISPAHQAMKNMDVEGLGEMAEWVIAYRKFHILGISESAVRKAARSTSTFAQFVGELFTEAGKLRGKRLAGEKCPGYVTHLSLLAELFPQTRFVHLIRDGRDVALSFLQWNHGPSIRYEMWEDEPIAVGALWWKKRVSAGRSAGPILGAARYCEVRYEEMVERPEETLRELSGFLELPFDEAMLRFHEGKVHRAPGLSTKAAWLPPTPGLRDWRSQMSVQDVELFEALAGDLLSSLGYERAFPEISPAVAAEARSLRGRFESERPRRRAPKT
jgi:Sulfotransferase family